MVRLKSVWIDELPYMIEKASDLLGDEPTPPPGPRDSLRAVLLLILFIATFFACLSAAFLRGEWAKSHLLSLIACTGGGVFLGACMLDLLPDCIESFEKVGIEVDFPIPEASVTAGFLLIVIIEQVAKWLRERHSSQPGARFLLHAHSHDDPSTSHDAENPGDIPSMHAEESDEETMTQMLGTMMLVMALSVHSLFEGLSMAVTGQAADLIQIFFALLLHKCIMGFCLGVRLVQCEMRIMWLTIMDLIFSIQVLIGGLAGIGIIRFISGGEKATAMAVTSVLQGIACGTFLYITTFEVLPHELNSKNAHRLVKLAFILLGFFIVVIFQLTFKA
ncbi:hypothetical protein WR25_18892 [Diploscapter pachys]|uniref:Zinc/iron permease n=1 Tax=Diploscapter pachys TaxID=2018661 RepID=A0A2A2KHI1_9BILA|nr:hypothetical protein WR25_18892 [Diploscapter pachys]